MFDEPVSGFGEEHVRHSLEYVQLELKGEYVLRVRYCLAYRLQEGKHWKLLIGYDHLGQLLPV